MDRRITARKVGETTFVEQTPLYRGALRDSELAQLAIDYKNEHPEEEVVMQRGEIKIAIPHGADSVEIATQYILAERNSWKR